MFEGPGGPEHAGGAYQSGWGQHWPLKESGKAQVLDCALCSFKCILEGVPRVFTDVSSASPLRTESFVYGPGVGTPIPSAQILQPGPSLTSHKETDKTYLAQACVWKGFSLMSVFLHLFFYFIFIF